MLTIFSILFFITSFLEPEIQEAVYLHTWTQNELLSFATLSTNLEHTNIMNKNPKNVLQGPPYVSDHFSRLENEGENIWRTL